MIDTADRRVEVICSGGCSCKSKVLYSKIKKTDYYFCGNKKCLDNLLKRLSKNKKRGKKEIASNMSITQNAAGKFTGIDFYTTSQGITNYGIYGEQKIYDVNEPEPNIFVLVPREKILPSQMEDQDIAEFISKKLIPTFVLSNIFANMSEEESYESILIEFGESMAEQIAKVKAGKYDHYAF